MYPEIDYSQFLPSFHTFPPNRLYRTEYADEAV